jgi:hypothetical protein
MLTRNGDERLVGILKKKGLELAERFISGPADFYLTGLLK